MKISKKEMAIIMKALYERHTSPELPYKEMAKAGELYYKLKEKIKEEGR